MAKKGEMSVRMAQKYLDRYAKLRKRKFVIGELIGGGMLGSVFRLEKVEPAVVVKISEDGGSRTWEKLCKREIEIMERLGKHENIVQLLDAEVLDVDLSAGGNSTCIPGGVYLLFMYEYQGLQQMLEKKVRLTEEELRQLAIDICKALEHCADSNVLHRDVKPGNIFCGETSTGQFRYLLGDFNAARIFTKDTEGAITTIGTEGFAAPEVMLSKEDRERGMERKVWLEPGCYNSDVYGLGITLYYMLSRKVPSLQYRSENARRELPMISENFEKIIMKAVRFDPRKRYRSATQMREALEALHASHETEVYQDNQFIWAKEALLGRKLSEAEVHAQRGISAGEENCRLLLDYCKCIRIYQQHRESSPKDFWNAAKPLAAELYDLHSHHKSAMALFLMGLLCQKAGMERDFCRCMQTAAEKGCVPAEFLWGKILFEESCDQEGRKQEGVEYMFRAANAEFLPALRYVKKYKRYLDMYQKEYPEILLQRLGPVDITKSADMLSAIIRFL